MTIMATLFTLVLLTLFTSFFVCADSDVWRPSTLSTMMIPAFSANQAPEPTPIIGTLPSTHLGLSHDISETWSLPDITLSRTLPTPSTVPNDMTAPSAKSSQAPQLRPEETDHVNLIATPKPGGDPLPYTNLASNPNQEDSEHTCAKHAEAALANWRYHCTRPIVVVFDAWCWGRAPSVKRCCTQGKEPEGVCSTYLPKGKGSGHERGR